jgi:hypothetical protein
MSFLLKFSSPLDGRVSEFQSLQDNEQEGIEYDKNHSSDENQIAEFANHLVITNPRRVSGVA